MIQPHNFASWPTTASFSIIPHRDFTGVHHSPCVAPHHHLTSANTASSAPCLTSTSNLIGKIQSDIITTPIQIQLHRAERLAAQGHPRSQSHPCSNDVGSFSQRNVHCLPLSSDDNGMQLTS